MWTLATVFFLVFVAAYGLRKRPKREVRTRTDGYVINNVSNRQAASHEPKSSEFENPAHQIKVRVEGTGAERPSKDVEATEYDAVIASGEERLRNAIPWCTDTSIQLPLKALTENQAYCLRLARLRYPIVPANRQSLDTFFALSEARQISLRTIRSLESNGMLQVADSGAYAITNVGLRALQTLPVKS